jgi:hypothetical protein
MTTIKVGSQDAEGFHPDGSIVDPAAVEEFISGSASLAAKLAVKANSASLAAKLDKTNNLSDLTNISAARTSLGLGDIVTHPASDFVRFGAAAGNVILGSATVHTTPSDTNTGFEVVKSITNPDKTFLGALSGYAVYFGVDSVAAGSIQGGACEAYSLMTGVVNHPVLGWENIATVAGTGTYQNVYGGQSTAQAQDTVTVTNLIGYQGRGPLGSSPNVTNAYTMKNLEPSIGTNRYTYHGIGRHVFVTGADNTLDTVQIQGTSAVRRWGFKADGKQIGYGSDGNSTRLTLDPNESTTGHIISNAFTGTTKHLSIQWQNNERYSIESDGTAVYAPELRQTTVGAAGAAAAPPATPVTYIKIKTAAGTALVIPAYAAA